jgi:hypothetical protein
MALAVCASVPPRLWSQKTEEIGQVGDGAPGAGAGYFGRTGKSSREGTEGAETTGFTGGTKDMIGSGVLGTFPPVWDVLL